MKLRILSAILMTSAFLGIYSCQTDRLKSDPAGFWSDSTGMALFEIRQESGDNYTINASLGSLKGTRTDNQIHGFTDMNDTFSVVVQQDTVIYSILGISIPYHRISKASYDSLSRLQSQ